MTTRVHRQTPAKEATRTRSGGRVTPAQAKRIVADLREAHGKKALSKLPKVAADLAQIRGKGPTKKELAAQNAQLEAENLALRAEVAKLGSLVLHSSLETHGNPDRDGMARGQGAYDATIRAKARAADERYYDLHGEAKSDAMFRQGY